MNPLVCRITVLSLSVFLLPGCGKKKVPAPEVAPIAERAPALNGEKKPGLRSDEPPKATLVAEPADPAVADVSADLLAADKAYEAWFKKYHLDLNDPRMLDADPDGDGATNREEFMADTNPVDPNSRPGIHKVMRLKEYNEVRVPLILESVDGHTAKIKHVGEGEQKTDAVTVGQSVGNLKVSKMQSRRVTDKGGQPVDLSRVDLEDAVTKEKVVLVKDMPARSATTSATLVSESGTMMKVHQGELFAWPTEAAVTYEVIDLRADQVVVQEVASKRMWTIPRR